MSNELPPTNSELSCMQVTVDKSPKLFSYHIHFHSDLSTDLRLTPIKL